MLMIFARQSSCLMISFKWCQVSLLGPSEDKSLYLLIACLNSSLEKELQQEVDFHLILLRILVLTWWLRALLKILWSASHRLSRERYEQPSYLIALIAGSLHLLIQFISSQMSRSSKVDFVHFYFLSFMFLFSFFFYSLFLFLEQLRLGVISHAVTSVTTWWHSHKTDHGT